MAVNYSWLQTNIYNIIMDGVSLSEGETNENNSSGNGLSNSNPPSKKEDLTELINAQSKGTGVIGEAAKGVGQSSYGIKGPNAQLQDLSNKALTLDTINNLVATSGAQDGGPYSSILRQRIVKIAASYVGLYEALPAQNPGWWDKEYEAKFKKLNPKWYVTGPWCAWFCQLVWKEAYTVGNALVKNANTLEYGDFYKKTWDETLKNGALIGAGAFTCGNNFKNLPKSKFITLNQAISGKAIPEPGDIAVYNYGHVDIVIKPFVTNGKLTGFSAIGGNTGANDARNGGETKYYSKKGDWKQVRGFCKVITPFNVDVNYAKK